MLNNILSYVPGIHREGYIFIVVFAIVSILLSFIANFLGLVGLVATLWCFYFFRDPIRVTPQSKGKDYVISPADGVVTKIHTTTPPEELHMGDIKVKKISIFLDVFNVHVNRIPINGTIKTLEYRPGKFINASLDKSSEDNERQSICITTNDGTEFAVVQIAGLIARRIVCDLKEGDKVEVGKRFGIIRFGSRVDIYLPESVGCLVVEGQTMIGGETVIADLSTTKQKDTQGISN